MPHRIYLIEDHPVMREGYVRLLARESDLVVCGEAATGREALVAIPEAAPDLVIVDLSIPEMNGLEVVKQLRVNHPDLACLVITAHSEALYAERALRAGARGFLTKDAPPADILAAIRHVLQGNTYLRPSLRDRLAGLASGSKTSPLSPLSELSDRELDVFEHFGRGFSTTQTAEALFISPKTVETHRANIKRKLGLEHANEVVQQATLWVASLDAPDLDNPDD